MHNKRKADSQNLRTRLTPDSQDKLWMCGELCFLFSSINCDDPREPLQWRKREYILIVSFTINTIRLNHCGYRMACVRKATMTLVSHCSTLDKTFFCVRPIRQPESPIDMAPYDACRNVIKLRKGFIRAIALAQFYRSMVSTGWTTHL